MVQNNKVLTVSYGTFSCTLEGFDDSFETMKSIAEYFRDLAAEDRYFGSEPPQPDAEMLTRIAQRDASRKVEARPSETGLLLRATEVEEPAMPAPTEEPPKSYSPDLNVVQTPPSVAAEQEQDEAEAFFGQADTEDTSSAPAPDSLAAKLQRIRAVVSHSDVSAESYAEEDDSLLSGDQPAPMDAVAAAFATGALSPEDLAPSSPLAEEEPITEVAPDSTDETEEPTLVSADDPTPEEVSRAAEDEAPLSIVAEEIHDDDDPRNDVLTAEYDDEDLVEADEDEEVNIVGETASEDTILSAVAEASSGVEFPEQGVLTEADESSLFQEISEIEDEMDIRMDQPQVDATDLDHDVTRLMAKADAEMDDPESSESREAYSHLRTAVAATAADDKSNKTAADEDYRGDLASVVSPRRPEIQVTSMRPESDSAAPLKLVAEQRIDTPAVETGPVTPRRVTANQDEGGSEEGGFAQFAQDQGAQSLSDLLEAAAAYLSFIEGQEQFSRPQLMNKVRSLKQDEFNREESLRSFGQLLRDGKIEKAGGGRFAASNLIGFRPDDEREAG